MNPIDAFECVKPYVEHKTKGFLEEYGVGEYFDDLIVAAKDAIMKRSLTSYFDVLSNGAVTIVEQRTGKSREEVEQLYRSFYLNGQ